MLAAVTRLWNLGTPAEAVYDETKVLTQAQAFLHGWPPPYSSHPPAGKLLVALSVSLFGNCPWGWRAMNAIVGVALVPLTYLLARRLFCSRLSAATAAGLLLCDGLLLVASRLAMINILYITVAAWAYLMLWDFVRESRPEKRRMYLLAMAILLGLFMSTKALISEVGVLLSLFTACAVLLQARRARGGRVYMSMIAVCALVGVVATAIYIAMFLPLHGTGWHGMGDLIAYHQRVFRHNLSLPSDFPDASPFWSWPLLLHPYAYWRKDLINGTAQILWCGGTPILWWAIIPAILIAFVRALGTRELHWLFLAGGYSAYLLMWIPIRRYLFIYSYMPADFFGILAVAGVLEECWTGAARRWEQLLLLTPAFCGFALCFGLERGGIAAMALLISHLALTQYRALWGGKFVFIVLLCGIAVTFAYFYPLWTALPISQAGYTSRMWLRGPGLTSWL